MKMEDKIAIVTGAGSGIGKAIALGMAREGAHIAIAEMNEKTGKDVTEQVSALERKSLFVKTDVSKEADVIAARTIIEKAGLGEYFIHITGHGIGFRYHEPIPVLDPENRNPLQVGMVFSVEPGVYIPGLGGIRIEDNVAVTKEGAFTLTTFDRDLGDI